MTLLKTFYAEALSLALLSGMPLASFGNVRSSMTPASLDALSAEGEATVNKRDVPVSKWKKKVTQAVINSVAESFRLEKAKADLDTGVFDSWSQWAKRAEDDTTEDDVNEKDHLHDNIIETNLSSLRGGGGQDDKQPRDISSCSPELLVDCVNGFVRDSNPPKSCAEECNNLCCYDEDGTACTGFTGKICKDYYSCNGFRACYQATIDYVFKSCFGDPENCLEATANQLIHSCSGGPYSCYRLGLGGYAGKLTRSCNGGVANCAYAGKEGFVGAISGGCNKYDTACSFLGAAGIIDHVFYCCNNGKQCYEKHFDDELSEECSRPLSATQSSVNFARKAEIEERMLDASPTPAPISSAPSAAPSRSSAPSDAPSRSSAPSDAPSRSSAPSAAPSRSAAPSSAPSRSSAPSDAPSRSSAPSSAPSRSSAPSAAPSRSAAPSSAPSRSSAPSDAPPRSAAPSRSAEPSEAPSTVPSRSSAPSSAPSRSSAPSDAPPRSAAPSRSAEPSDAPSTVPTRSSAPSDAPPSSAAPSRSAEPSDAPSTVPSRSSAPSAAPSAAPSRSAEPSDPPSVTPTESAAPSADPSSAPSVARTVIDLLQEMQDFLQTDSAKELLGPKLGWITAFIKIATDAYLKGKLVLALSKAGSAANGLGCNGPIPIQPELVELCENLEWLIILLGREIV